MWHTYLWRCVLSGRIEQQVGKEWMGNWLFIYDITKERKQEKEREKRKKRRLDENGIGDDQHFWQDSISKLLYNINFKILMMSQKWNEHVP